MTHTIFGWVKTIVVVAAVVYFATCGVIYAFMMQSPPVIARALDRVPGVFWMALPMQTMWLRANRGTLEPGDQAPDFDLPTIDGQSRVRLSSLRGQPVVLFFGSYTCPPFRRQMPDMNALYAPFHDRAAFYFIYVEEAHATDGWQSSSNLKDGVLYANARTAEDRVKAGSVCATHLKIPFPLLADGMDNQVGRAYRAWPTRVYVIDKDGRVAFKTGAGPFGFEASEVRPALERLLGAAHTAGGAS